MHRTAITCTALASLGLLGTALLTAGPLTPPPGPVASTHKTLTEVEPRIAINSVNTPGDADSLFRIDKQGAYYLTSNITGQLGKHGIEIAASGVTLDLNAFDLVGKPGMGVFSGVTTNGINLTNIAVFNGSIRGWGNRGIDLEAANATNSRVERVRCTGNGSHGILVDKATTITDCESSANALSGIITLGGCVINNCFVSANLSSGIAAGSGSSLTNCAALDNLSSGIALTSNCTATSCSSTGNVVNGIFAQEDCVITGCTSRGNIGTGISAGGGSVVTHCAASNNTTVGITAALGSIVVGCAVRNNTTDGISCSSDCTITGNTCVSNGLSGGDGAGIHASGSDNRIEGNTCTDADRGIDVDAAGNIIIQNTCAGNTTTNWDIAANNYYGPIINRVGAATAAQLGNGTGVDALASTHPNANFSY